MNTDFEEKLKNALCNNDQNFLEHYKNHYDINHSFIDEYNDSLLLYAISDCDSEVYKYLLSRGADLFAKNDLGEGILHSVIFSKKIERLHYLLETYPSIVNMLNDSDNEGSTPILFSIMLKQRSFFDKFLQMGADIHLGDKQDITPLHMACLIKISDSRDNFEIVRSLVESGANFRVKTKQGNYPLALAVNNDFIDIVKYLSSIMYI
ncbi:ankyrin repeat domain-containing protein [Helicobacter cappadocius]|uniref:Ankyrin repeat domain-containing protein n=1 Tax=Helicobacter cappadocius TaxID=3063998 RepID=A0AA90T974_9HELI|nr:MULTISPECIES: ankyrin repeat domain-containing protein [unclassified Helicobacter]MDO7252699.1 ankyrin repeat domain-containing protein [Helicobacter sp. faydin-H75]MDP2538567.1 ankyrin repeat domain-containing protein [Helicobacter sp. faydin-H76]